MKEGIGRVEGWDEMGSSTKGSTEGWMGTSEMLLSVVARNPGSETQGGGTP